MYSTIGLSGQHNVRYLHQFGEHILTGSFTPYDPGCAKTREFNLRVENSSQFGLSENQKCWRRVSEEGNRENGSTLSWLAHVFTRPGPLAVVHYAHQISARVLPTRNRGEVSIGLLSHVN